MSEALKWCPFCGGPAEQREYTMPDEYTLYSVGCSDGECRIGPATDWLDDKEAVVIAWNKRAPVKK